VTTTFADLGLAPSLVRRLADAGIDAPFPIQAATIPDALAGRDVLGRGRTGSGKTLAFALPLVSRLADLQRARARRPKALVLVPTRELATQVATALAPLAQAQGLRHLTVFGGVPERGQIRALQSGVEVVVACPGRLRDLLDRGHVDHSDVQVTVLDEADHMADLGFLPVVRRLLDATPAGGQRLLFSATLDGGVDVLVRRYLSTPVVHSLDEEPRPTSEMAHHVLAVTRDARVSAVADLLGVPGRTVVFTRTKRGARTLARQLRSRGIEAVELHGDLAQGARTRNLAAFSSGRARALVATDIAARGIHVDDVSLVIHADPPAEHKAYLHRSGRTARAGATGTVVTMMVDEQADDLGTLMRRAGIQAQLRTVAPGDPVLRALASQGEVGAGTPFPTARTGGGSSGSAAGNGSRPRRAGTQGSSRRRSGGRRTGGPQPTAAARPHSAASFSAGRGR
jgi:superfamily II DNA/RNA helicase